METELVSQRLAELGNQTRLAIFKLLVRAGPDGLVVGEIQGRLNVPASTLSHHLARLGRAGLIEQRRASRNLHCFARHDVMNGLVEFLTAECCLGFGDEQRRGDAG
ncbi:MAG: metalloregulator ArsR/SmtB family transcription factor [Rhodospirillales bacterium]|jgi:DNA-binding transcriptional ArsR family regulator|nr:metalloregulator ArsR/SmtB family transcription factor [Rhodospirillales bacterium]MDP6882821.1 metalloregulator ArsR/SmtB family transcription factor [Rhodospirillales bacterium]